MCGEMAGDPRFTRLLLGLGLRIFSMDPTSVLEVKKKVRGSDAGLAGEFASRVLECAGGQELRDMVAELDRA